MSSTFMRRSLIEEEEEHDSDVSGVDSGSDSDDVPILARRRVVRNPNALTLDAGKPYLQQTQSTKQETQRKMEVRASPNLDGPDDPTARPPRFCPFPLLFGTNARRGESSDRARSLLQTLLNRAAHTPEFQPGAYNAAKLSEDAVRLLADFILRPSVRKQLNPLVGELRGKKRKGRPRAAVDDSAVGEPRRKAFISKETGRRVRTTLTLQQTRVLQDKFEEQKHWNPKQCAAMLPNLNQLGPDLAVEQVIRWFDNRRRTLKARGGSAPAASGRAGDALEDEGVEPSAKKSGAVKDERKTRRVSQVEREILEAAFSKNAAPDIRVRHALATATDLSQEQVTAWFMRRQATKRAPYGVIPGANGMAGVDGNDRMVLPGIFPNHLAAVHSFGASHAFMHGGLLQADYVNAHGLPPLGPPLVSGVPQNAGFGMPNVGADAMRGR